MTLVACPKPIGRVLNPAFVAFVRTLPCILRGVAYQSKRGDALIIEDCRGRTEANHAGDRPKGRKADDDSCLPMCSGVHHPAWTDSTGFFATWRMSLEERHAWRGEQIERVRKAFNENRGAEGARW